MYIYFKDLQNVIHLYSIYHYIYIFISRCICIYIHLFAYIYISIYFWYYVDILLLKGIVYVWLYVLRTILRGQRHLPLYLCWCELQSTSLSETSRRSGALSNAKKEMQGEKDEDSKDSEDAKDKTQKLVQAASDGVPWSSFCSAVVARNQLSLEMGKSTSHAQQVVIMQAALLLFTAPFQMHHPHVKKYQDRKWYDMMCGLSKPKTLGRKSWNKKLQSWIGLAFSLATQSYPFVAFVSCAYGASLSFAIHSIGIQCPTCPGFAIKNYWDATSSPWRTRSNG